MFSDGRRADRARLRLDSRKPFGYYHSVTKWFPKEKSRWTVPLPGDDIFKALADPTRREILSLLRERRRSVGELATNFHMSRPAVSKHLRQLRAAGLVVDRHAGTARICELNAAPLQHVDDWLHTYRAFWTNSLARLKTHIETQMEEKRRDTN